MIDRREIEITLADGNEYLFSERNKRDCDKAYLSNFVRRSRIQFLKDTLSNSDERLSLIMMEMERDYLTDNAEENAKVLDKWGGYDLSIDIAYNSFKIKNDVSKEEFEKLITPELLEKVIEAVMTLEGSGKKKEAGNPSQKK